MGTFTGAPMAASSGLSTRVPAETTKSYPGSSFIKQVSQSIPVNQHSGPPPGLHPGMLKTSTLESMSFATPEPNRASAIVSESSTLMASDPQPPLSTTINHYGDDGPDGPWTQKHSSHAPIYAAASILPIVVLVMVGAVFCICLRRRKQRRKENSALPTQGMKQSKHTVLTHVAPPARGQSPSLSGRPSPPSPPSQLQPVILGPILSSSNGAYMTGMDTWNRRHPIVPAALLHRVSFLPRGRAVSECKTGRPRRQGPISWSAPRSTTLSTMYPKCLDRPEDKATTRCPWCPTCPTNTIPSSPDRHCEEAV